MILPAKSTVSLIYSVSVLFVVMHKKLLKNREERRSLHLGQDLKANYSLDPDQDPFALKVMVWPREVMLGVPPASCVTV